jgi:hypothetical protein
MTSSSLAGLDAIDPANIFLPDLSCLTTSP